MRITFPKDYPAAPPTVNIVTPIHHPYVHHNGDLLLPPCVHWTPDRPPAALDLLRHIRCLLSSPATMSCETPSQLVPQVAGPRVSGGGRHAFASRVQSGEWGRGMRSRCPAGNRASLRTIHISLTFAGHGLGQAAVHVTICVCART